MSPCKVDSSLVSEQRLIFSKPPFELGICHELASEEADGVNIRQQNVYQVVTSEEGKGGEADAALQLQ